MPITIRPRSVLGLLFIILIIGSIVINENRISVEAQQPIPMPVDENLQRAWNSEALLLANLSQQALAKGDTRRAIHLALEGLKHYENGIYNTINHEALLNALTTPGLERVRIQHNTEGNFSLSSETSPDDQHIATWFLPFSSDTNVRVHDLSTGQLRSLFRLPIAVGGVRWNHNGNQLLAWTHNTSYVSPQNNVVAIWDIDSGANILRLQVDSPLRDVHWTDDESALLIVTAGEITKWNVETGDQLLTLNQTNANSGLSRTADILYPLQQTNQVIALVNNYSSDRLSYIYLWETNNEEPVLTIPAQLGSNWRGIEIGPNERYILIWDNEMLYLWNIFTKEQVGMYTYLDDGVQRLSGTRYTGFSPSGDYFFAVSEGLRGVSVWDTTGNTQPIVLDLDKRGFRWGITDNHFLWWGTAGDAAETSNEVIQIMTLDESVNTFSVLGRIERVAWSPETQRIAITKGSKSIHIWSEHGTKLAAIDLESNVRNLQFIADGQHLQVQLDDGSVRVFDMIPIAPVRFANTNLRSIWSADGSRILGWDTSEIRVYDDGEDAPDFVTSLDTPIRSARWHPEGDQFLTFVPEIGRVSTYDATIGEIIHEISVPLQPTQSDEDNEFYTLLDVDYNASGTRIAVLVDDGLLYVYNSETGELMQQIHYSQDTRVSGSIRGAMRWNPVDDTQILTWSREGKARIWDIETSLMLREYSHGAYIVVSETLHDDGTASGQESMNPVVPVDVAWSPDGSRVLSYSNGHIRDGIVAGGGWTTHIWSASDEDTITFEFDGRVGAGLSSGTVWYDDMHVIVFEPTNDNRSKAQVLDLESGEALASFEASGRISSVIPRTDSGQLLVYPELRNVETGEIILRLPIWGQWHPTEDRILIDSRILPIQVEYLIQLAQEAVQYNQLTMQEVNAAFVVTPDTIDVTSTPLSTVTPIPSFTPTPTATFTSTPTPNAALSSYEILKSNRQSNPA